MEVELAGSERLFGGREALRVQLQAQAAELGVVRLALGPTRLAALALARAGVLDPADQDITACLHALPFAVLSATREHRDTLAQLGCRTLGDMRRPQRMVVAVMGEWRIVSR